MVRAFAIAAIVIALGSVLLLALFLSGLEPRVSIRTTSASTFDVGALLQNIGLLALFGLQHSGMARSSFKAKLKSRVPQVPERNLYVASSGLVTLAIVFFWQPINTPVWEASSQIGSWLLWGGYLSGLVILLAGFIAIDPLELMGLRQSGWAKPSQQSFRLSWLHQRVRHPIYTGFLLVFWMTPTMTLGHLLFAVGMSAYIRVGIFYEEKDLLNRFPEDYLRYKRHVPMLLPQLSAWKPKTKSSDNS